MENRANSEHKSIKKRSENMMEKKASRCVPRKDPHGDFLRRDFQARVKGAWPGGAPSTRRGEPPPILGGQPGGVPMVRLASSGFKSPPKVLTCPLKAFKVL